MRLKLVACCLLMASGHFLKAQSWGVDAGIGYVYGQPKGLMSTHVPHANGLSLTFAGISPSRHWSLGMDMSFMTYEKIKSSIEIVLPDGTEAPMELVVHGMMFTWTAEGRYYPFTGTILQPYANGRLGYAGFETTLNIYDADDWDNCSPVESEILNERGTVVAAGGGGMRIDLSGLFNSKMKEWLYLDLGASYYTGGKTQYMVSEGTGTHATGIPNGVEASFLQAQTRVVHTHYVGYRFDTRISQWNYQAGLVLSLRDH